MRRALLACFRPALLLAGLVAAGCPDADANREATPDAFVPPVNVPDGGTPDGGTPDGGTPDAGPPQHDDRDGDGTANADDCAPDDATRDHQQSGLFADADGDGWTVGSSVSACVGSSLVGFAATASATADCDDGNAQLAQELQLYVDDDGDGFGHGEAQSVCTSGQPAKGFALAGDDCDDGDATRFHTLSYQYRDADGDHNSVEQPGALCLGSSELPPGYEWWPDTHDCDDSDPTRYELEDVYSDVDVDGVGDSTAWLKCVGQQLDAGWSRSSGDCAPSDARAWHLYTGAFLDADRDGFGAGSTVDVCAGEALPNGYVLGGSQDCDDADPHAFKRLSVFQDEDHDGFGAGDATLVCTDGTVPTGVVTTDGDCAPGDATRWQMLTYDYVDRDGDGQTVPEHAQACSGNALPKPYVASATGNDCDDANATLSAWRVLYPDQDDDGVGTLPYQVKCSGTTIPDGYSRFGDDEDDTDPSIQESDEPSFVARYF